MISYEVALATLLAQGAARRLPSAATPLAQAAFGILGATVRGHDPVPPFTNSAMDGFAVEAGTLSTASPEAPVRRHVSGRVVAGDADVTLWPDHDPARFIGAHGVVEIMTGAPLPPGPYDAVVRIEDVEVERDEAGRPRWATFRAPVPAGAELRREGSDIPAGDIVLTAGRRLSPEALAAAASVGLHELPVVRRPRIALFTTGPEVVPADGAPLPRGKIRDSNGPFLAAALALRGVELVRHERLPDDPAIFRRAIDRLVDERIDVVLTTGAVSAGVHDFVPRALEEAGATLHFHKVAIRPGKPVLFGSRLFYRDDGPLVLGLPGNPVATMVGVRFFLDPLLDALRGVAQQDLPRARLAEAFRKPEGLRCFYKAHVAIEPEGARLTLLTGQASFQVRPLLSANAWALLPAEGARVEPGAVLPFASLHPTPFPLPGGALA